jgi:hypothetical protein
MHATYSNILSLLSSIQFHSLLFEYLLNNIYIVIRLKAEIGKREETTIAKHPPAAADTIVTMEELLDAESESRISVLARTSSNISPTQPVEGVRELRESRQAVMM